MKRLKFIVKSPEHSKRIQEYLFSLGYEWGTSGKSVVHLKRPYIYAHSTGHITFMPLNTSYAENTIYEPHDLPNNVKVMLKFARSQKC